MHASWLQRLVGLKRGGFGGVWEGMGAAEPGNAGLASPDGFKFAKPNHRRPRSLQDSPGMEPLECGGTGPKWVWGRARSLWEGPEMQLAWPKLWDLI